MILLHMVKTYLLYEWSYRKNLLNSYKRQKQASQVLHDRSNCAVVNKLTQFVFISITYDTWWNEKKMMH